MNGFGADFGTLLGLIGAKITLFGGHVYMDD